MRSIDTTRSEENGRGWARARRLFAFALLLALAVPAVRFLRGEALPAAPPRELDDLAGPRPLSDRALAGAPCLLLVTADRDASALDALDSGRARIVSDVVAASPDRDPALASLLTGEPVLAHRVLFDGDVAPPLDPLLAERLAHAGYETAVYGADRLPGWAAVGATPRVGGLDAAARWVAGRRAAPRFAHAHVEGLEADALRRALGELSGVRAVIAATTIVGAREGSGSTRFLERSTLAVELALVGVGLELEAPAARPHSAGELAPTLLVAAGIPAAGDTLTAPAVPVVVSLSHGRVGRPHRLRAGLPTSSWTSSSRRSAGTRRTTGSSSGPPRPTSPTGTRSASRRPRRAAGWRRCSSASCSGGIATRRGNGARRGARLDGMGDTPHAEESRPDLLLVDNDEKITDLLRWFLEERGFAVRIANSFRAARAEIEARRPHLLVSDVDLGAESALVELPRLAAEGLLPPTLVVSGFLDADVQRSLQALPAVRDTLAKPFEFPDLEAKVLACLAAPYPDATDEISPMPAASARIAADSAAPAEPSAPRQDETIVDEDGWIEITPSP